MKKIIFLFVGFLIASFSSSQYLKSLIAEALKNNPEIRAFDLKYSIASEEINGVNTFSNTEFGIGYFLSEPETRVGAQNFKISVKQMLPWFGTIVAEKNYVGSLAATKYQDLIIAKRKLVVSVSQSYYDLYENKLKQSVLEQNQTLLKIYKTLALKLLEAGKYSAVEVLKIKVRENEIENRRKILIQQYLSEQTLFNKLLNRDKKSKIDLPNQLIIPDQSDLKLNKNLNLHPELIKYDKLYQSVEQSELLNKKESRPKIGLGLNYINVQKLSNTNFRDNGKDIIMPSLSFSIPIFDKKYKSKTRQHSLQEQEILLQKQNRLNILESILERAINDKISARISYKTQANNLKQTERMITILKKEYEAGLVDIDDILDVQELQLNIQINQIEALKNYYKQIIIINYLTQ